LVIFNLFIFLCYRLFSDYEELTKYDIQTARALLENNDAAFQNLDKALKQKLIEVLYNLESKINSGLLKNPEYVNLVNRIKRLKELLETLPYFYNQEKNKTYLEILTKMIKLVEIFKDLEFYSLEQSHYLKWCLAASMKVNGILSRPLCIITRTC